MIPCIACNYLISPDKPSRLVTHAKNKHNNETIHCHCSHIGCSFKEEKTIPVIEWAKHEYLHWSTRRKDFEEVENFEEDDSEEETFNTDKRKGYDPILDEEDEEEEEKEEKGELSWFLESDTNKNVYIVDDEIFEKPLKEISEEQLNEFDFLNISLKHSVTQECIKSFSNSRVISKQNIKLPSAVDMKRKAEAFLKEAGLGVSNLAPSGSEPVPFFSVKQCLRFWMLHPELSKMIIETSEKYTEKYVFDVLTSEYSCLLSEDPDFDNECSFSTSKDGSEWLNVLKRTKSIWCGTFLNCFRKKEKVVFVHIMLFGDGLPLWKKKSGGFEVINCTLAEFEEGTKSSPNSPAIMNNCVLSKNLIYSFFKDYQGVLKIFTNDFNELAKGKKFYCNYLKKTVTVIGLFYGFQGDSPGRSQASCFKRPGGKTTCDCSFCLNKKQSQVEDILSGKVPPIRNSEKIKSLLNEIEMESSEYLKYLLKKNYGINGRSEMWNYPGAELNKQMLVDIMHSEAEGEISKHFLLLSNFLISEGVDFYKVLNINCKSYFNSHDIVFPDISSEDKWNDHLNAADRLKFFLHSVAILEEIVSESYYNHFMLWSLHVSLVQLSSRHCISNLEDIYLLPFTIQKGIINFYGRENITFNSHLQFHYFYFIILFSSLRFFWGFPMESILKKIKNFAKKLSNHKSVSFSMTNLFTLDRVLPLLIDETKKWMPVKDETIKGIEK
jgi:hypothetical protein